MDMHLFYYTPSVFNTPEERPATVFVHCSFDLSLQPSWFLGYSINVGSRWRWRNWSFLIHNLLCIKAIIFIFLSPRFPLWAFAFFPSFPALVHCHVVSREYRLGLGTYLWMIVRRKRVFSLAENLITDRWNGLKEAIILIIIEVCAYTAEALVQEFGGMNLLS